MIVLDQDLLDFRANQVFAWLKLDYWKDETENIFQFLVRQKINESLEATLLFFIFRIRTWIILRCCRVGVDNVKIIVGSGV